MRSSPHAPSAPLRPSILVIPPVAHFIWFGRELPWAHALSIRSAALRGGFDEVVLHHADDLSSSTEWATLTALPTFRARRINAVALINAIGPGAREILHIYRRLQAPAARANVLRAAILYAEGGVYLDLDTITLQPLTKLRETSTGFCGEERVIWPYAERFQSHPLSRVRNFARLAVRELCRRLPAGWRHFRAIERWYPAAANNAVLGAAPRHRTIRRLLDGMRAVPRQRQRVRFALGVHLLQDTLAQGLDPGFKVLPPQTFYPLAPEISHHWFQLRPKAPRLADVLHPETLVVHWYASIRAADIIPQIDAGYVLRHADRQLFATLVLPLIDRDRQQANRQQTTSTAKAKRHHPVSMQQAAI